MRFQKYRLGLGWSLLLVLALPMAVLAQANPSSKLVEAAKNASLDLRDFIGGPVFSSR